MWCKTNDGTLNLLDIEIGMQASKRLAPFGIMPNRSGVMASRARDQSVVVNPHLSRWRMKAPMLQWDR